MSQMENNRLTLSISALFVLALLMYLPTWLEEETTPANDKKADALRPAYKAKNITTTLFNSQGELNHQVFAVSMEHYDQLGFVLFGQPRYTVYLGEDKSPWNVTALEGTLYNNEVIQLDSNVVISSVENRDFIQQVKTEFLEINLNSKNMNSDQPVQIIGEQFLTISNGFNGNLQTQQYELTDHVQTTYSPDN